MEAQQVIKEKKLVMAKEEEEFEKKIKAIKLQRLYLKQMEVMNKNFIYYIK